MELVKASNEEHWVLASKFLTQAVERCNRNGTPLWTYDQVNITSLRKSYSFEQLYLLRHEQIFVGCVFISFDSDAFWEDIESNGSIFFHKLAFADTHNSKGLGARALTEILSLAQDFGCIWMRCDCHGDRFKLRSFYEQFGFEFVDRQDMFGFDVARYQMQVKRN
jgi:GNAT superfamily N-acetyltransferase